MSYRVELDIFRGPIDLLLYLVRRHEVEAAEVSVARVAEQYLRYLESRERLDVDAAGDFLEVASTLVELKSRELLPQLDEVEEPIEDPRADLVRRLLDYKKFRDAASLLDERSRDWQERMPRVAPDAPTEAHDPADQPLAELELWDLVTAFARIVRQRQALKPSTIVYDETPIEHYMQRIGQRLMAEPRVAFASLFAPGLHKSAIVGIFLAVLELVRHHGVRVEQGDLFDELWIMQGEQPLDPAALSAPRAEPPAPSGAARHE